MAALACFPAWNQTNPYVLDFPVSGSLAILQLMTGPYLEVK